MRRGFWIWKIANLEGGDPLAIAAKASQNGLTDVMIKVADGTLSANVVNGRDLAAELARALKAVGIKAWGWHYSYAAQPGAEAALALKRILDCGLDGYIFDAEAEYKTPFGAAQAEDLLTTFRVGRPAGSYLLGFSSFRYPSLHKEFPWAPFLKYCDLNFPQVYFEQAHNPDYQLTRSLSEFAGLKSNPKVYPVGPAYQNAGWEPTLADTQTFIATAEKLGVELVSFFSWDEALVQTPAILPAIFRPAMPATPPADPTPLDRLEALETQIRELSVHLEELRAMMNEIQSQLSQVFSPAPDPSLPDRVTALEQRADRQDAAIQAIQVIFTALRDALLKSVA